MEIVQIPSTKERRTHSDALRGEQCDASGSGGSDGPQREASINLGSFLVERI